MSHEIDTFRHRLRQLADQQSQHIALRGEVQLTYAQLEAELGLRQAYLRDISARVVAVALENGPDALLWDLAILFEGLVCLALPPFFSPAQRQHCLAQSQADLVIAPAEYAGELTGGGFHAHGLGWRRHVTDRSVMPMGTAKLTFTSGTTGTPKGVCLSAESVLKVARALHEASQSQQPQQYLSLLPLSILLENIGCYAALYAGATLSLPSQAAIGIKGASGVDLPRLLTGLKQWCPDSMILVPQLLLMLVAACEAGAFDTSGLRFVAVGGARVSLSLLHRAEALGIPVYEGYGLSECSSVIALNRPGAERPASVGKPLHHVRVRIADDGEVLIAGAPMLGYLGDDTPVPEWWPTGDLGSFDEDGFLYLKGRKKHQFVTSFGRNVNPEWVEAELTQLGLIGQALVNGEAMDHNHALLWPLRPETSDEQLAQAVMQANLALPDYAQVRSWTRLQRPFSPNNGMATANGRPRRDAILSHYREHFSAHTAEDF